MLIFFSKFIIPVFIWQDIFIQRKVELFMEQVIREERVMMTAEEVAEELQIKKGMAYKLIREWNEELKARGKLTIRGRINREYFKQKVSC